MGHETVLPEKQMRVYQFGANLVYSKRFFLNIIPGRNLSFLPGFLFG